MERKISFGVNEYYHVYNRGVDKRKIFLTAGDYRRFTTLLYLANTVEPIHWGNLARLYRGESSVKFFQHPKGESLVAIGCYCLMPNHFHLLLREIKDGGISKFMLKLQTGYSMYFNTKNERKGALWQGVFKAEHATDDEYLQYLFSYIHLNPTKLLMTDWRERILSGKMTEKLYRYVVDYPYSSCRLYNPQSSTTINKVESTIVDRENFPNYLAVNTKEYRDHLINWLTLNKNEGSPR